MAMVDVVYWLPI